MAKKKLSRDQKRKQTLAKRAHGSAGRAGAQADFVTRETERVIYETFMSFGRGMRDQDVLEALSQLVVDVQKGQVSQATAGAELPNAKGALIWNLKQGWSEKRLLANVPSLLAAQAVQVLAHHVDDITAIGESHSYLRFLQGIQEGAKALIAETAVGDWTPEESELRALGLAWLKNSNAETFGAFRSASDQMMETGKARIVAEICQYLYGAVQRPEVEQALRPLLDTAHAKVADELEAQIPPEQMPAEPAATPAPPDGPSAETP